MDKTEALARLDALEAEAAKLRKAINAPDPKPRLVYNDRRLYVVVIDDEPYLLAGREEKDCFSWHCFADYSPPEQHWDGPFAAGQAALDYVQNKYEVREFANAREGMDYFYKLYCEAYNK